MSYKNCIDHIIDARGCDPHYHDPHDDSCVYELEQGIDGQPFIRDWTPPDASYGDQPTEAEIAAVSEADQTTAQEAYRIYHATTGLTDKDYAMVQAVAAATSVDPDDLLADYIQRLADA